MNPIDNLKSVLCDPAGKCCITGSDEDRAIVDRALQALAEQPAQQEPVAYAKDLIEGLYENGDPISVDAAELLEQLTAQQEPAAQQEPVACHYGDNGYACCAGGPCAAEEHNDKTDWQERGMVAEAALAKLLDEKGEPVAVVSGYYGGQCVILPIDPARIFNSNTALYTSPPAQRKPLTDEQIWREYRFLWPFHPEEERKLASDILEFARALEAAHGIKENT